MNIKVVIAVHKPYVMPRAGCYLPLQVGRALYDDIGYAGDNTGDNISEKNFNYCELTGLYWAWKNLNADAVGLVHYRRYLGRKAGILGSVKRKKDPFNWILRSEDIEQYLQKYSIILPKKRRYYIESLYSHYAHTHYAEHLDITREVLEKEAPGYVASFDRVMKRTGAHMFNMFIMTRDKCDAYCSFLFPVLEELEGRIDVSGLDAYQARLFGRISELLLDVWLDANGETYTEVPLINIEKTDWWKKGMAFMKAKLIKKKYEGSF